MTQNIKLIRLLSNLAVSFIVVITASCAIIATPKELSLPNGMTRGELVSLIPLEQNQIVRSLPPEVQAELWRYKWDNLLSSNSLSKQEKKVIKQLNCISARSFISGTNNNIKLKTKAKKVSDILRNDFAWSNERIEMLLGNVMTLEEIDACIEMYGAHN